MFYIYQHNEAGLTYGDPVFMTENYINAKAQAEAFKHSTGKQYGVYKLSQVYTTQTLDEAIKN